MTGTEFTARVGNFSIRKYLSASAGDDDNITKKIRYFRNMLKFFPVKVFFQSPIDVYR